MKKLYFLIVLSAAIYSCTSKKSLTIISTTPKESWVSKTIIIIARSDKIFTPLKINTDSVKQVFDGFGACFNELGWEALLSLPLQSRELVLYNLFSKESGCRFNLFRLPIGANDYAVNWYSNNETS